MAQLRHEQVKFIERDTTILVLGPENAAAFKKYWLENDLPFIGLPDPTHSILKLYGQEIKIFKFGRMPAQVLVDKRGMVRFVHYGHSMSNIPENDSLLAWLEPMTIKE